jgi:hypothetical protein
MDPKEKELINNRLNLLVWFGCVMFVVVFAVLYLKAALWISGMIS